jgi:hypothetical protein
MLFLMLRPNGQIITTVVGEVLGRNSLEVDGSLSVSKAHFTIMSVEESSARILHTGTSDGRVIRQGSTEPEDVKNGMEITLREGDRYLFVWGWESIYIEAVNDEDANQESDEEVDDPEDDDDLAFIDDDDFETQNGRSLVSVARELTENICRRLDPEGDKKNPTPAVKKPVSRVRKFRRIPILEKLKKQKLRVTTVGADTVATHEELDAKLIKAAKRRVPKDAIDKGGIMQTLVDDKWVKLRVELLGDKGRS